MARRGRLVKPPQRQSSPSPIAGAPLTVRVDDVGASGMGRARAMVDGVERDVDVPYVLAGETVEIRIARHRGERFEADLLRVIEPAAVRQPAACVHFATCGGCAFQHWPDDAYAAWKEGRTVAPLNARNIPAAHVSKMLRTAPRTRRRADFTLRHTVTGPIVGFARRAAHDIVDLQECPVLMPALASLIPALRAAVPNLLPRGATAEAVVNWTDTGADVLLVPGERLPLDLSRRMALAALAEATDMARISWGGRRSAEPVVTRRRPILRLGQIEVEPPPGAFLQASPVSEVAMRTVVRTWLDQAKQIVDLFGGIGTLSLDLVPAHRVTVIDGSRSAVATVDAAVRKAGLAGAAEAMVRDLARDPLSAAELNRFDAAIFDPPRSGAAAQAAEMARSRLSLIVAVSCDPHSFAQDARVLVDGGYRLEQLIPIDQFLWSPHVELVALFRR